MLDSSEKMVSLHLRRDKAVDSGMVLGSELTVLRYTIHDTCIIGAFVLGAFSVGTKTRTAKEQEAPAFGTRYLFQH